MSELFELLFTLTWTGSSVACCTSDLDSDLTVHLGEMAQVLSRNNPCSNYNRRLRLAGSQHRPYAHLHISQLHTETMAAALSAKTAFAGSTAKLCKKSSKASAVRAPVVVRAQKQNVEVEVVRGQIEVY